MSVARRAGPEGPQAMLHVFGPLRWCADGKSRTLDLAPQPSIVLVALAVSGSRPLSYEQLAAVVWDVERPVTWRSILRNVLVPIRSQLLGTAATIQRSAIGYQLVLDQECTVDIEWARCTVRDAQRMLDGCGNRVDRIAGAAVVDIDRVADMLGHQFLANVDTPWVDEQRREIERLRRCALRISAALLLASGQPAAGNERLRELTEADPYDELAWQGLMRSELDHGDRRAALRIFEQLRRRLWDDLATVPSAASMQLQREALGEAPSDATSGRYAIGRDAELCELRRSADRDTSRFVQIIGVEGAGKSSLLDAVLAQHRRAGVTVAHTRCLPLQRRVAVHGWASTLLGRAYEPDQPDSVAAWLDRVAGPTTLVIDDAQWLDPRSVELLKELFATDASTGVWLVLARRPMPRSERAHLVELVPAHVARTSLTLGALGHRSLRSALLAHGVDLDDDDSAVVHRRSQGRPGLALELAGTDGAVPERLVEQTRRRLRHIDRPLLDLLLRSDGWQTASQMMADLTRCTSDQNQVRRLTDSGIVTYHDGRWQLAGEHVRLAMAP